MCKDDASDDEGDGHNTKTVILRLHLSQDPEGRSGFWSLGNWTSGIKFFGQKPKTSRKFLKKKQMSTQKSKTRMFIGLSR